MAANNHHDPDYDRSEYLNAVSDVIAACRGFGHTFPKLVPGRVHTRNLRTAAMRDGGWQVTQICEDCGTERTFTTLSGGKLEEGTILYSYAWPDGYKSPPGSGVTRRDCLSETLRRANETLTAEARAAAKPRRKKA